MYVNPNKTVDNLQTKSAWMPHPVEPSGLAKIAEVVVNKERPWTPTVRLDRYFADLKHPVDVVAKLESYNPTGSIKYRPALRIISQAIEKNRINSDSIVVESSSGNMGAAMAYICREFGLKFVCVVDPRTQAHNLKLIEQYGGQLEYVREPLNGCFLQARLKRVNDLIESDNRYYWTNQYANEDNFKAHYYGTAAEIFAEHQDGLDVICVATSSAGTFHGIYSFFQEYAPRTIIVAIDAIGSILYKAEAGVRKVSGMGAGFKTPISQRSTPDKIIWVNDIDCAVGCHRALQLENLSIGGSGGGILEAIRQHQQWFSGKRILTLMADGGDKYQSSLFDYQWLHTQLGLAPETLSQRIGS